MTTCGTPREWLLDILAALLSLIALAWVFFWIPLLIDTPDSKHKEQQHTQ